MTVTQPERPSRTPHRRARHVIDEASGRLGHAPAPTTRAEATALAGERHEPLERTLPAPQAGETGRQHATGEKVPELLLHEHREAGALGMASRRVQEGIQVRFDHAVQHAAFGVARLIRARERHARDIRPADGRGQCRKRDTSKELGQERRVKIAAAAAASCGAHVASWRVTMITWWSFIRRGLPVWPSRSITYS
jgi:hypothetical protein